MSFLPERVVIVGQVYVGLLLAMRAAEVGHDVVGFPDLRYVEDAARLVAAHLRPGKRVGPRSPTAMSANMGRWTATAG